MIKAVFWDLGGTLCRTDAGGKILGAIRIARVLRPFCRSFPDSLRKVFLVMQEYKKFREDPAADCEPELMDLVPRVFPVPHFDPLRVVRTVYEEVLKHTTFLPGAEDALAAVTAAGLPMVLVSDGFYGREYVQRALDKLGIKDKFKAVVVSCEVGAGKPKPALFLAACRAIGVKPEEVLFVGDKLDLDIAGAAGVGMKTVLVGKTPRKNRPDCYLPDLRRFPEKLSALLEKA